MTEAAQVFAEDKTLASIRKARVQFRAADQVRRLARYHGAKAAWVLQAWTENWLDPGFARWSVIDVLPRVRCPVLAIHGEMDEYGSLRHPRAICEQSGGRSRLEIMKDTGRVPHRQQAELVLRLLHQFVAGI